MDNNAFINQLIAEGAKKPLPHPLKQTMLWLGATMIYLGLVVHHTGVRPDIADKIVEFRFAAELVLLFFSAVMAAYAAICFSRPDAYQNKPASFAALGLLLIWAVVAFAGNSALNWNGMSEAANTIAYDCMGCIALMAVPPAIGMFLMVRKGAPTYFYRAGAMATLAVTIFAYLCMRLIEPTDNPGHLILWHALPVALMCLIGTALGKIALRWK